MEQILVFSGTTEGNALVRALRAYPVHVYVSVATEYGEASAAVCENTEVVRGRMDQEQMQSFLRENRSRWSSMRPIRLPASSRKTSGRHAGRKQSHISDVCGRAGTGGGVCICREYCGSVTYLEETTGNILLTTGSKELQKYTRLKEFRSRCYARVLSTKEAVEKSIGLGFEGKHLLAMQGPFSKEMNKAMIAHVDAKYVVTKETGKAGGFPESWRRQKRTEPVWL